MVTVVELGGVPGQTVGLDAGLMAHKRVLNLLLPLLQKAESDAELKGLKVHFLIPEHNQVNTAARMHCRTCRQPRLERCRPH